MIPEPAAAPFSLPILSLLIFLPLAWALLLPFLREGRTVRIVALAGAVLELVLSLLMLAALRPEVAGMQFVEQASWIPSLNVHYLLGIDGIAALFPPLTALLFCAVILASWTSIQFMPRLYFALLLALESVTMGVFCALDLVLFFLFWELTLVPIYFLISLWGIGPERRYAATKYTLFMLAGGIPLLFGMILLGLHHASAAGLTFDYRVLLEYSQPGPWQTSVFLLLFFGFAVKAPLFPFHTWLPTVLREGPAGLSALLVGLKLGVFGILRFALPLAPTAAREYFWLMTVLGLIGLIYGALVALRQSNLAQDAGVFQHQPCRAGHCQPRRDEYSGRTGRGFSTGEFQHHRRRSDAHGRFPAPSPGFHRSGQSGRTGPSPASLHRVVSAIGHGVHRLCPAPMALSPNC